MCTGDGRDVARDTSCVILDDEERSGAARTMVFMLGRLMVSE